MSNILNFLLDDSNLVFSGALVVLLVLFAIEVFSLMVGMSASHAVDHALEFDKDFDLDHDVDAGFNFLSWLGVGKAPFMVIVALFLAFFTIAGLALNWIISGALGFMLPKLLSAPIALIAALPAVRAASATIGRLIPQDYTNAIRIEELVGSTGTIVMGTASTQMAAEARVTDKYGVDHYVLVKPIDPEEKIANGSTIYLDKLENTVFLVSKVN